MEKRLLIASWLFLIGSSLSQIHQSGDSFALTSVGFSCPVAELYETVGLLQAEPDES
jgi:hypothetical protein